MYTVAQGKALMRSPAKHYHSGKSWNGWCAAFVYWFTGASRSFATAYDSYLATKIVSKDAAKAPAGAIHYWRSTGSKPRPGHVAVSLGNGIAAMASARVTTRWGLDTGTIPIAEYNRQTSGFMQYLGWSYDFGGQKMAGVQTLAQIAAAVKSTPKTYKVKSGDYLNLISTRTKVSVPKLIDLNKSKYPSVAHSDHMIQPGWTLKLK